MGWTRRANPKWHRNEDRGQAPSEVRWTISTDRYGTIKPDNYCGSDWTDSRSKTRRKVNKLIRQAGKRQIQYALSDYLDDWWQDWLDANAEWEDALEEEYLQMLNEEEEYIRDLERQEEEDRLMYDDFYLYEEPWDEMY
jgi:hypothetical protein